MELESENVPENVAAVQPETERPKAVMESEVSPFAFAAAAVASSSPASRRARARRRPAALKKKLHPPAASPRARAARSGCLTPGPACLSAPCACGASPRTAAACFHPQAARSDGCRPETVRVDGAAQKISEEAAAQRAGTSSAGGAAVGGTTRAGPPKKTKSQSLAEGLPELVIEEGAPPIPASPRLTRMDTPAASGALMSMLGNDGSYTDDGSPNARDDGLAEGQPMDKIIRSPLAEGDEEDEDSPEDSQGGGGLSLELPDGEASPTVEDMAIPMARTPAGGVVHNSIAGAQKSPVKDPVGKVHAVAGDLATP